MISTDAFELLRLPVNGGFRRGAFGSSNCSGLVLSSTDVRCVSDASPIIFILSVSLLHKVLVTQIISRLLHGPRVAVDVKVRVGESHGRDFW